MSFTFEPNGGWLLRGLGALLWKRTRSSNEGFFFLGQCTKLELSLNDERLTENSAVQAATPPVLDIVTKRTPKVAATLKEAHPDVISLAVMGDDDATLTQAGTAVTEEVHEDVRAGYYVKLDKLGPVTAVTVEPSGGGTAFTEGDDYIVFNGEQPMIYIVPGGGIDSGDDIQVDYTPTAYTAAPTIPIGSKTLIQGELLFLPDPTNGPKFVANIWKCSVASESVTSLIQPDANLAEFALNFTVLSDAANHPNSPYGLLTKVGQVTATS